MSTNPTGGLSLWLKSYTTYMKPLMTGSHAAMLLRASGMSQTQYVCRGALRGLEDDPPACSLSQGDWWEMG